MDKYADIEQEFDEHFQQSLQNNTFDINNHDAYRKLLRWIDDDDHHESEQNISDDVEMMESEEFTIPIDPICRTEINIPIRNKQCGHLYDKENLFNLFRNNRFVIIVEKNDLLKKKISLILIYFLNSTIKCPVSGCSNRKVTANDVEEDSRLRILIEKAREKE